MTIEKYKYHYQTNVANTQDHGKQIYIQKEQKVDNFNFEKIQYSVENLRI